MPNPFQSQIAPDGTTQPVGKRTAADRRGGDEADHVREVLGTR
ncbi:hypothetical protein [Micromonospora sp. KC723]|nr:hypothetical protein [Micromonospora sp. KC723]